MIRRTVKIGSKKYEYDSNREYQIQTTVWWFLFIPVLIRESAVVGG